MKRLVFAGMAAVMAMSASAVSYRGFFDLMGGIGTGSSVDGVYVDGMTVNDIRSVAGFGVTTTHGCQILPNLFAGAGVGVYTVLNKGDITYEAGAMYGYEETETDYDLYGISIPIYADVRWDLDIRKKVTPFVDVKIGYQIGVHTNSYIAENYMSGNDNYVTAEAESGLYFMPTVGVRFRTGKTKGFNLGLCYNPTVRKMVRTKVENYDIAVEKDVKKVTDGLLMLSLSFDF